MSKKAEAIRFADVPPPGASDSDRRRREEILLSPGLVEEAYERDGRARGPERELPGNIPAVAKRYSVEELK